MDRVLMVIRVKAKVLIPMNGSKHHIRSAAAILGLCGVQCDKTTHLTERSRFPSLICSSDKPC